MSKTDQEKRKVYFVSGIDTGIGKTYATAVLARSYTKSGKTAITQKMVQTGCSDISEDILLHRKLMGLRLLIADRTGTTCPYVFSYPASPHLSAELEEKEICIDLIHSITESLLTKYEVVLLEGAGGLMVPINRNILTIDYIAMFDLPVVLVTSGRLGSINHTLLSLEACQHRSIVVDKVIYNCFPLEDELIADDTFRFLESYLAKHHPSAQLLKLPEIKPADNFVFEV